MRFAQFVLFLAVILAGCGGSSRVTAPSPTPSFVPPVPTFLHGTVVERTPQGERPLAAAYVWGELHGGTLLAQVRTDEFGRYELPELGPGARLQVMAWKEGYLQQCASEITVGAIPRLDLPLVANANVSSSRDSVPPSPPGFRIVAGVVYELTPQGRRAVPHRSVFYAWGSDPAAATRTDDQGRFLLCGLPQSRTVAITEAFGGGVTVPPGGDADIEIQVKK
jgi:hypothetical protein